MNQHIKKATSEVSEDEGRCDELAGALLTWADEWQSAPIEQDSPMYEYKHGNLDHAASLLTGEDYFVNYDIARKLACSLLGKLYKVTPNEVL